MKLYSFINTAEKVDMSIEDIARVVGDKIPTVTEYGVDYEAMEESKRNFYKEVEEEIEALSVKASKMHNPIMLVQESWSNYFGWNNVAIELKEDNGERISSNSHEGSDYYTLPYNKEDMRELLRSQTPYIQEIWNWYPVPDWTKIRETRFPKFSPKLATELV